MVPFYFYVNVNALELTQFHFLDNLVGNFRGGHLGFFMKIGLELPLSVLERRFQFFACFGDGRIHDFVLAGGATATPS